MQLAPHAERSAIVCEREVVCVPRDVMNVIALVAFKMYEHLLPPSAQQRRESCIRALSRPALSKQTC